MFSGYTKMIIQAVGKEEKEPKLVNKSNTDMNALQDSMKDKFSFWNYKQRPFMGVVR